MNPEEFTISFSNFTSLPVFTDNTLTKFRYRLNNPIELTGQWEVALVSFSYPNSWFLARNAAEVKAHKYYFSLTYPEAHVNLHSDITCRFVNNMNLKSFFYAHGAVRHLITHKEKPIFERNSSFTIPLTYSDNQVPQIGQILSRKIQESEGMVEVEELMNPSDAYVNSDGNVEKIVGHTGKTYNLVKTPSKDLVKSNLLDNGADLWTVDVFVQGQYSDEYILPIPANTGTPRSNYLPAIFIYSDLVEYQNVGSNLKPLLGFVAYTAQDETNDVAKYEPRHQHFKRVNQGYISEITVDLKDVFDDPLVFKSGEVILELLFRKCK